MSYLIIIFVIALALAPLSHFVPSKAQRRVARLRQYAALKGLFVEFRDPPASGGNRRAVAAPRTHAHTIYYGKRVGASGRGPDKQIAWLHREEGWCGQSRGEPVPDPLSELPDSILAASADWDSCGVYWQESGEEAEIDQICKVLLALKERLYQ